MHKTCFSKTDYPDLGADSIGQKDSLKGKWQQTAISVRAFCRGAGPWGYVCVRASGGGSEGLGLVEPAQVTCAGSALLFCLLAFVEG